MTHTEESLMALALDAVALAYPSSRAQIDAYDSAIAILRLAIREVLAERDEWKRIADDRFNLLAENKGALHWKERAERAEAELRGAEDEIAYQVKRAEKAEAECERLKQELVGQAFKFGLAEDGLRKDAERYRWMRVPKNVEALIDAAMKDQS